MLNLISNLLTNLGSDALTRVGFDKLAGRQLLGSNPPDLTAINDRLTKIEKMLASGDKAGADKELHSFLPEFLTGVDEANGLYDIAGLYQAEKLDDAEVVNLCTFLSDKLTDHEMANLRKYVSEHPKNARYQIWMTLAHLSTNEAHAKAYLQPFGIYKKSFLQEADEAAATYLTYWEGFNNEANAAHKAEDKKTFWTRLWEFITFKLF